MRKREREDFCEERQKQAWVNINKIFISLRSMAVLSSRAQERQSHGPRNSHAKRARRSGETARKIKNRLPGFVAFSTAAPFNSFWHPVDNFDFVLRRWFVQCLETLQWKITKIFDWRANILNQSERSVRWRTDRLKKAPRPCRRFFKLLQPQSPRGFSASPAFITYLAHPTKTAMLRRLDLHLKRVHTGVVHKVLSILYNLTKKKNKTTSVVIGSIK